MKKSNATEIDLNSVEIRNIREAPHFDAALMIEGEAEGAIPNGTRIIKSYSEEGDSTRVGSEGTVLSSIHVPADLKEEQGLVSDYFYFVEWDWMPGVPVGIAGAKISRASVEI